MWRPSEKKYLKSDGFGSSDDRGSKGETNLTRQLHPARQGRDRSPATSGTIDVASIAFEKLPNAVAALHDLEIALA